MIEIIADKLKEEIHMVERVWDIDSGNHTLITTKNIFSGDKARVIEELLFRIEQLENKDD